MNYQKLCNEIKGKIIVSCQALPGEPLYCEERTFMDLMAKAAKKAGSPAIRANSIRDIKAIKAETGLPVFGIIKQQYDGFDSYITPTMKEVDMLHEAGVEVIAVDCTDRKRGDGLSASEYLTQIKNKYKNQLIMADIATYEEGMAAYKAGADFISTTMCGYTEATKEHTDGPALELIKDLSESIKDIPIIAEGRIHSPEDAVRVFEAGAYAAIVGGAITRPLEIASRFIKAADAYFINRKENNNNDA
ncbi:MAG: N-acetylmannosamine-6-phosphate 2-epimerase [Eubacteriales bacterium]|nr:N-acetylmannosamine-6-phosphate 2-epimerase [Eubacteriales bacterium]